MENKVYRLAIKELDKEAGKFRGYLSVFNNIDQGGDLVEPGAFTKTLDETPAFPLLWAHSAQETKDVVGTFHGIEDKRGLLINGEFLMNREAGRDAHDLVKALYDKGIKVGLSIGYKTVQFENSKQDDQLVRRLKEVQLFEGSLTLFPMNDQAMVQAIKDGKNVVDADTHGKTVKVVCGECGKTVMEIIDPAAIGGQALDAREPADATLKTEPPPENQVLNALGSLLEKATRDLSKI